VVDPRYFTSADVRAAMANANVKAMGRVVREGETDQTDRAYYRVNGRPDLTDLSKHPYDGITTTNGARASGAYQHLGTTWAGIRKRYPDDLRGFTPPEQDFAFVVGLADRGALGDVIAGRFEDAVAKLEQEWTSLPGANENNPRYTMSAARQVFIRYGGTLATAAEQAPAPIEDRGTIYEPASTDDGRIFNPEQDAPKMAPIVLPLLSIAAQYLPSIAKIISDGGVKGRKIEEAAPILADVLTKTVGAINLQEAVEKVADDKTVAQAADNAIVQYVATLTEVGGGIAEARKWSTDVQNAPGSVLRNPALLVTIPLLLMVIFVVTIVLAGRGFSTFFLTLVAALGAERVTLETIGLVAASFSFSADMQNVVITAVISGVLGSITGFFYGLSLQQRPAQRATDPPAKQ
jgi:muramidase (phage lysozyme)